ncbi:type VI secretion system membrane subunit TssM [Novosphingobium album (ex Liu et al. 2023)]|uniref:Type VI secretion system membrane subunit TssM n=1 Tax=Novosphingobium album (ex Liu et al. 2023) TaxID=3031130 RepID=A0ABT5WV10_9SPHN|nr:type VI secretion system membrane subunit TssM [Novosphingobium album (ex Liu et al. 2023)]MDE8653713.1 type VI secretion system membrane subunit TssM [Novosphingobium album (ex Liu et al. 2023)]
MRKIFGSWWVLGGIVTLLLVLVFCVGLPFFVGWLRPWWVRLLIGGVLVFVWLLIGYLGIRKRRKAAKAIEAALVTPSAADQESAAVAARMAEALAALRSRSKNRDYLYSKPWYVIIGPPGAGKTTALLNSGLLFPFADQSVKGVGGTRNLDFWFADEAALVDTAGRYTTQESDPTADAEGWKSFLGQLRKQRPLSPINGIIVAIGVDELLNVDRAGLDRHASLVRRRLAELRSTLEVAVPAYLLITKADLIAGFVEYYDDLDVEGRRAVLGATMPVENKMPSIDDIVGEFDRLINAQFERQAKRLFEEVDQVRRSLILGFPSQLAAIRNRMARFVEGAFLSGEAPSASFRGFYLTSGVQAGAPLDRILAGVAETFHTTTGSGRGSGRTYFLNRLLTEVVFKEAGLVRADPAARKRQQLRLAGGLAVVGGVVALILAAWMFSFARNRAFLADLNLASSNAMALVRQTGIDLVEVRETDPDLEQSLAVLAALRDLPQGFAQQAGGEPGWGMRFGLYQSSHADQAVESYRDGLRRILLPRILLRIEQYIQANAGNPMALYQPLKVYLMLGGWGPMDKGVVKSWVTADWAQEAYPGADRAPMRKELAQHLDVLLEDEGLASSWGAKRRAPLDGTVIATARGALQTLSMADLAYAVLKQKALATSGAPWRASAALAAGDAQAFANGQEVLQAEVPYFFTRAGHEKAYQAGLVTVAADFQKELWVLGEGAGAEGTRLQMSQIRANVARLYARDYISAWERIAKLPRPANYFTNAAALGAFTKTPSPLKVLLLEVRKNTTFEGGSGAAGELARRKISNMRYGRYVDDAADIADDGNSYDAGTEISNYFKPLHDYVGNAKEPGALDEFIGEVKQAGAAMTSARIAGGGMGSEAAQGQMAMSMGGVATAAGAAPALLKDFVMSAASGGEKETVSTAQGALTDVYTQSVLPQCQLATAEKYPFFGTSAQNASLVDVQQVFAMGGSLDGFFEQRVMPLLDTSGPIWRWNANLPVTADLSPSSPDEFAKARKLRDLLVAGLTVRFEAKSFGAEVSVVDLSAGGNQYRFETGDSEAKPVIWSAQDNVPEASLTMYAAQANSDKLTKVRKLSEDGPWALFRLMDQAHLENTGPTSIQATFGNGGQSVVFKISLPDKHNPFVRGAGVWSFRCPVAL